MATDKYAGGHEFLRECWPFEEFEPGEHAHEAYDSGYYNHTHDGGSEPHSHKVSRERLKRLRDRDS